ncbi:hypothetical protein SDC9_77460 [bioreactor metagenome]|uniref:Uncharacterized protein n=1 Tax=bioreactor metagenome TaxID=1076179 RepID=A0A644YRI5_9ZZZZ
MLTLFEENIAEKGKQIITNGYNANPCCAKACMKKFTNGTKNDEERRNRTSITVIVTQTIYR